ncbi:GNAT family N-acetyltransferase [Nocardioides sp. W7]|uniref:GNAT family N-acetyltransferase n=1 Tax=Nocardioides sp. W7 TaxID=2931390 RepID=UPI001FD5BC44|nr:GNAT family N-acetyltransferase [Nocardioides sp. W7]
MTPQDVAAASAAWLWFPDDATVYSTEELLLVDWPAYFGTPPTVLHLVADDEDDVDRLLVDADARVRSWGYDALDVRVQPGAPAHLRETLEDLDGEVVETVDVHAIDLAPGVPDLGVPADVEVRWQLDEQTTRDHLSVSIAAFGEGELPDDERLRELADDTARAHREGLGAAAVAYLDGRPIGTGGLTLADGEEGRVARLWGAGVVPEARGRGGYRAVLAARLQYAVAHDAEFALVKGRVETSGPILRRAGFTAYGQELTYRLSL